MGNRVMKAKTIEVILKLMITITCGYIVYEWFEIIDKLKNK